MFEDFNIASRLILEEARSRGINTSFVYKNFAKMQFGNHIEYLHAQISSKTTAVARRICADKNITKTFLRSAGISVADGKAFTPDQLDEAKQYISGQNHPFVIKPATGGMGKDVFLDINNEDQLEIAWKKMDPKTELIVVERQFSGEEYRLMVTREKFLAATKRVPANVVGDGVNTIAQLVEQKNSDPRRSDDTHDPIVKIRLDDTALFHLEQSGYSPDFIPEKSQTVYIRKNSNISTGGDSYDYTDKIHDTVKEIALRTIKAIPGLAWAGIDFMSQDTATEQKPDDYIIVEVNSSPGIDMHHFPYSGQPRDVARDLIDLLFPETASN